MVHTICKLSFILSFAIYFNGFSQTTDSEVAGKNSRQPSHSITNSNIQKPVYYEPHLITNLSPILKETSGLLYFNGQLWTINDSGNPPVLYQVDTVDGSILRTVTIRNAVNTDWESLTRDDSNVYIGDFGNNSGNRTNLHILKIPLTDLLNPLTDTAQAGYIHFSFSDQPEITNATGNPDFDCEAFVYHKDSLHLFSKNWTDQQTRHYVLPADTGTYLAMYVEQFNTDGLITDASVNEKGNIILLGYKNTGGKLYNCFTWLLSGYKNNFYFSGKKQRIELGSALRAGQTEGVVLENDNSVWLSAESIQIGGLTFPAKLFRLDVRKYF
jgi:hypothetical protein